jgi:hypothetical protein
MTTTKWTINTREQQDLRYPAERFNEKRCLPVWVGDVPRVHNYSRFCTSGSIPVMANTLIITKHTTKPYSAEH